MINNNLVEAHCLRCNQIETWDHIAQCSETLDLRKEFIIDLKKALIKANKNEIEVDITFAFGEDIMRYFEHKEEEKCETSQCLIGVKELFRGHVVKAQKGVNMNSSEHKKLNKVAAKYCVDYYVKCWKHRNEACYDTNKQKERIKNWLQKERKEASNTETQQVKDYARKFKIDKERCNVDKIKNR